MELDDIRAHWQGWAEQFKGDIRATTKTPTIKLLEIDALKRAIEKIAGTDGAQSILEVGCGNGHNCIALSKFFPQTHFTGVDYIGDMVKCALDNRDAQQATEQADFYEGNVLDLDSHAELTGEYDIAFTDRCLINLNSVELQLQGLAQIAHQVKIGGHVILIENINDSYSQQNALREHAGLAARTPDKFNLFFNESELTEGAKPHLQLVRSENFASLHDIMLYVITPMVSGKVDYESPYVKAVTDMLLSLPDGLHDSFGGFGQNRLYVFRRTQ